MSSHVVSSPRTTGEPGERILRYTLVERVHHWLGALFYIYCLITGLAFWSPYLFWLAVLVGGGPTGVEMAGAVAELAHHTLAAEFRKIDPATTRIVLLEAGPRLLAAFPQKLSEVAMRMIFVSGSPAIFAHNPAASSSSA